MTKKQKTISPIPPIDETIDRAVEQAYDRIFSELHPLGQKFSDNGDLTNAFAIYESFLTDKSRNYSAARVELGRLKLLNNDYRGAQEEFNKARGIQAVAYRYLGHACNQSYDEFTKDNGRKSKRAITRHKNSLSYAHNLRFSRDIWNLWEENSNSPNTRKNLEILLKQVSDISGKYFLETNTEETQDNQKSNRPILILTGGKNPPNRTALRIKRYFKDNGEQEVLIIYDESWHAPQSSYRYHRASIGNVENLEKVTMENSQRIPLDLRQIISLFNPRSIEIHSNNYSTEKGSLIAQAKLPTKYFLDYAAGTLRGYQEGERTGIEASQKIVVARPELLKHLKSNYQHILAGKTLTGPGTKS